MMAQSRRLAAPLAALLLCGCSDESPHEPKQPEPARIALSASFAETAGGTVEAYTKSNTLWLQFSRSSAIVVEETFAFDGNAAEVHVPVEVPLRETTERLLLQLELRLNADAIFRGSTQVELTAGRTAAVELTLQPVVAAVDCAGPEVVLDAVDATAQLQAVATFATGDTIPNPTIAWSASGAGATAITVGAATGLVTARADGSATVTCSSAGVTSTRAVRVFAVVTSVAVAPPTATVLIGATQSFTATLRDRLNNVITGRTVTWTSAHPTVASVNTTGTATGLAADTARIVATVGSESGSALLTVMHRPPAATTSGSANVTGSTATVSGTVNPTGAPTSAFFEYGTSPTLATSTATTAQAVGNGSTAVAVSADLVNLAASTTYYFRTVASSAGGTTRGAILSFTTLDPPTVTTTGSVVNSGDVALLSGTVNPNGVATTTYFEYGTSPTLDTFSTSLQRALGSGTTTVPMDTTVRNLTPSTTYYFRIVASSAGGTSRGAILSFTTLTPPTVTTTGSVVNSGTRALLSGTANPNGLTTTMWFEYGTSATLATFTNTFQRAIGSGNTVVAMDTSVSSLTAGTTYYFRAVAINAGGTSRGAILSFTTPSGPIVTTVGSAAVSGNEATLRATINPNSASSASIWFEYGTSPTLATSFSTSASGVGSGFSTIPYNETVELASGTTYYFRAAGQNADGTSRGAILSFTTLSPAAPTARTVQAFFPTPGATFGPPVVAEGVANPNGLETEVYFEFSPYDATLTSNYYATGGTECEESSVCSHYDNESRTFLPAGTWQEVAFSEGIFDDPCEGGGTWVRAVAVNALGTARGNIYFLPNRACLLFMSTPAQRAPSPPTRNPGGDSAALPSTTPAPLERGARHTPRDRAIPLG